MASKTVSLSISVPSKGQAATALSALMAVLSIAAVALFLLGLLVTGGQWLLQGGITTGEDTASNFGRLLSGSSELYSSGIYQAIIGTAVLTLLMTILVAPLGVVVALYMGEYARSAWYVQVLRIAIQNLAAVPSVIYGVFALGFFVYGVGGQVDQLFFSATLPSPRFGKPGLLWAALTMALLTLPTVIVATEEGLYRLPRSLREGSLALGATQGETVLKILLPGAAPSILTGVVLAVARAAGEVAPLMLVGVIKYAPQLPVSADAPYLHLDQQFMHLGFVVYDIVMHTPAGPNRTGLIATVSLLLVSVVVCLNVAATVLRSRLRRRFNNQLSE